MKDKDNKDKKDYKASKAALSKLRVETTLYKEQVEKTLQELGYKYMIPTDDMAKMILISLVTMIYGYTEKRLIILMSLGLIDEFSGLNITQRRDSYIEWAGKKMNSDAMRHQEDRLLKDFVKRLGNILDERGKRVIDEALEQATNTFQLYLDEHYVWSMDLPSLQDKGPLWEPSITLETITIDDKEEGLVNEIHDQIAKGIHSFALNDSKYSSLVHRIDELFYCRYNNEYDALIIINEDRFQGISRIVIRIEQMTNAGLLTISTLSDIDDLRTLIGAYDDLIISYVYFSDERKGPNDYDEIEGIRKEIIEIAEGKGVIFYLRRLRK